MLTSYPYIHHTRTTYHSLWASTVNWSLVRMCIRSLRSSALTVTISLRLDMFTTWTNLGGKVYPLLNILKYENTMTWYLKLLISFFDSCTRKVIVPNRFRVKLCFTSFSCCLTQIFRGGKEEKNSEKVAYFIWKLNQ